jgi:hypothetical protein
MDRCYVRAGLNRGGSSEDIRHFASPIKKIAGTSGSARAAAQSNRSPRKVPAAVHFCVPREPEPCPSPGFVLSRAIADQVNGMNRVTMQTVRSPVVIALAVAAFGIAGMLLVDHGPWTKPHLRTAQVNYGTTAAAAQAVGARVTPTPPKPAIEPIAPGPKQAEPPNPVPP